MGLDMYLYAEVRPYKDSELHAVIERHLSDEHRESMKGEDGYAYVSGWSMGTREPDPLYTAVTQVMQLTAHEGSPHIDLFPGQDGSYRVAVCVYYWRKANAIHAWFVDQVQKGEDDCQRSLVHPEQLAELVDRCEQVTEDHSFAEVLLPSRSGFFFGPTDYDEWYYQDLKETATGLRAMMATLPKPAALYYQASW
jgi:hypothetical protein